MSQSEVLDLLEKIGGFLSVGEIAKILKDNPFQISRDLNKMLQYGEIESKEIDKEIALKKYRCKHKMKIYSAKGMFLAVVDLATGKIFGCKKDSKVYWHEKGHIKFNNSEFGFRIAYYQIFFMMLAVFFGSLCLIIDNYGLKIFTLCNALGMIVCYIYEEVWCWKYGMKHFKSREK